MNIGLSLMNSSTADRFPNIIFITKKKNIPTLREKQFETSISEKCSPFTFSANVFSVDRYSDRLSLFIPQSQRL